MADFGSEELGLPFFDFDGFLDDRPSVADTSFLPGDDIFCSNWQEQKVEEKSPFHESDSGVSDLGGRSPPMEDIPMLDEMHDPGLTGPFLLGESDMFISQDEDLARYLQEGSNLCEQTSNRNIPEADGANDQDFRRKTRSQSTAVGKKSVPVSSYRGSQTPVDAHSVNNTAQLDCCGNDSDVDVDSDVSSGKASPKGSVRVKRAGAKLPSATGSDKCSVTSVKVLRIVKSESDGSTEDVVTKALEERNRKNAEMARQNRLKKKEYVGNLEQEVEDGRKKISELKSALNEVVEERDSYRREVEYLKSVLANQSALAGLLKNIPHVGGVTLSSSVSRKRNAELDHSYTPMKKACHAEPGQSGSGVCLHVNSSNVSLEFCHHCADMANGVSTS